MYHLIRTNWNLGRDAHRVLYYKGWRRDWGDVWIIENTHGNALEFETEKQAKRVMKCIKMVRPEIAHQMQIVETPNHTATKAYDRAMGIL